MARWRCFQCPFGITHGTGDAMRYGYSEMLEALRKDVEYVCDILKARFEIPHVGIRLQT
jgi:hypothetical protein